MGDVSAKLSIEIICCLVLGRCAGEDVADYETAFHHLDWSYSSSKTLLFAQSRFEIEAANRTDLVPSIVTAKHLDFFKAEPITKFKPGVFDDGLLQKMDASFLKAFLNPSRV